MHSLPFPVILIGALLCISDIESGIAETPQTGTFRGTIRFQGDVPVLPPLVKQGDSEVKDAAVCAASSIPDESLVVAAKSRGIANVFVYLRKRPETFPAQDADESKTPQILKVEGCRFVPHAMVMRTTDRVKLEFRDEVAHHAHAYPIQSTVPGALIAPQDESFLQEFDESEPFPVKVGCDIHPWMKAYVLPLDHPFAAVTDQKGRFKIDGLPPGMYEFWFWQEKAGWLEKKYKVNIKAGRVIAANLSYTADRFEQ